MKGGEGRDLETAVKPQSPQRWGTAGKPHWGPPGVLLATQRAVRNHCCLSSPIRPPRVFYPMPPPCMGTCRAPSPHVTSQHRSYSSTDSAHKDRRLQKGFHSDQHPKSPRSQLLCKDVGLLLCVPPSSTLTLGTAVPRMNSWGWHLCNGDRAPCNGDKAPCSGGKARMQSIRDQFLCSGDKAPLNGDEADEAPVHHTEDKT